MSRTIEIAAVMEASSWTDITAAILSLDGLVVGGQAYRTEIGTGSGFDLDDDNASRSLPARRVVRIIETATSPDTTLFKGRVADKGTGRGQMPIGDARQFDVDLDDNNTQLYGIPVDRWKRPAETGRARVVALGNAFLNGSPRASTNLDYATYVPNTNTVQMPAKTYEQTDPAGVIRDCAEAEGKNAFVTVDDELFYDLDTSTAYAADLSITDDDPNLTTEFPPIWDTGTPGSYEGNEFFSGAILRYGTNKRVTEVRATVEAAHDFWRTVIYDTTKSESVAFAKLKTLLDNQAREEFRATCSLQLTAAQVELIKYGQTVSFRAAAAGQLTPITLRVARLMWVPIAVDLYRVNLELGVPMKLRPRAGGAPAPTPAPDPTDDGDGACLRDTFTRVVASGWGTSEAGYIWDTFGTNASTEVDGANGVFRLVSSDFPPSAWARLLGYDMDVEPFPHRITIDADLDPIDPWDPGDTLTFSLSAAGGAGRVLVRADSLDATDWYAEYGSDSSDTWDPAIDLNDPFTLKIECTATVLRVKVWASVDPEPGAWDVEVPIGTTSTSLGAFEITALAVNPSDHDVYIDVVTICSGADTTDGQPIIGEFVFIGDSAQTEGTTNFPYRPGSLRVMLDGVRTFDFTESDPEDGIFTFGTAPGTGVEVRVDYEGA